MSDTEPKPKGETELKYNSPELKSKINGWLDRFENVFLQTPEFTSAITDKRGRKEFKFTKGTDTYKIGYWVSPDKKNRALDVWVLSSEGGEESIFLEAGNPPGSEILYIDGEVSIIDVVTRKDDEFRNRYGRGLQESIRGIEKVLGKLGEDSSPSTSRETSRPKPPKEGETDWPIKGPLGPMPLPGGRSPWGGTR